MRRALLTNIVASVWLATGGVAAAGQDPPAPVAPSTIVIKGPPAPIAPAIQTRDAEGGTTVRAVRLTAPLNFDGKLDEAVYTDVPPITGLIQVLPDAGQPATEETEAWVMFDDDNVYVSARLWLKDMDRTLIANEMRRDKARQNDDFGVAFDTFYDRQTGYLFYTPTRSVPSATARSAKRRERPIATTTRCGTSARAGSMADGR